MTYLNYNCFRSRKMSSEFEQSEIAEYASRVFNDIFEQTTNYPYPYIGHWCREQHGRLERTGSAPATATASTNEATSIVTNDSAAAVQVAHSSTFCAEWFCKEPVEEDGPLCSACHCILCKKHAMTLKESLCSHCHFVRETSFVLNTSASWPTLSTRSSVESSATPSSSPPANSTEIVDDSSSSSPDSVVSSEQVINDIYSFSCL